MVSLSFFCFSFSVSVAGRESLASRVLAICSTMPSKTEMIMTASRVSLNTMKKIGTENTFGMADLGTLQGGTATPGRAGWEREREGRSGRNEEWWVEGSHLIIS